MSFNRKAPQQPSDNDPAPLALVKENRGNLTSPIIPNPEDDGTNEVPLVPSPGYHPDVNGIPVIPPPSNQPSGSSTREAESDGNSLGVLYQSTVGSIIHEDKSRSGNDLGSRLNSPLITGQGVDPSSMQMEIPFLDMGLQSSSPFLDNRAYQQEPLSQLLDGQGLITGNQRLSGFNNGLFEPINLSLSPKQQDESPKKNTVLNTLLQPPPLSSLPGTSEEYPKQDFQCQIPSYVSDILQQNDKPTWYAQLFTASAVTVPVLLASTLTYHSLQDTTLRDVFIIEGFLPGCTYPSHDLSLSWFRESLGDYYEGSVQTIKGARFKCGLNVCEALFQMNSWPLCIVLDSNSTNGIASYSPGTLIDQLDWTVDLKEFQRHEKPKYRDSSFVVSPKSVIFLSSEGVYDGRLLHVIDNSLIFVQRGCVRVYFFAINGRLSSESLQTCSQGLSSLTLVMCVDVKEGDQVVLPSGKLFIIQAHSPSVVIVSRFLCGLAMRRQITSYRQLFTDANEDTFKWQFWKVNWLAAMRYVRYMRAQSGIVIEDPSERDRMSPSEKLTIPFLVVALKILHEIYGSGRNDLQAFEALIAEKLNSPGPLGVLLELSTRCRDNGWTPGGHQLLNPDDMSATSEDTTMFVDISPYPDSIDSNKNIDQFVADASPISEKKEENEGWMFRCPCGIEQENYDDGKAMVQCCVCEDWSHIECAGYDPEKGGDFICSWCKQKRKNDS